MIKPILFRGGMCGDLILGMLDQTALLSTTHWQKSYGHSTCGGKSIKYTRTFLKKFFQYTDQQKTRYYETFKKINQDVYFLTHDTDFSMNYKTETVQIVCSDIELIDHFAKRFHDLHRKQVIDEARKMIQNNKDFISDYKESVIQWQKVFTFPHQFDIKNIFNKDLFIRDMDNFFRLQNKSWAESIYTRHVELW